MIMEKEYKYVTSYLELLIINRQENIKGDIYYILLRQKTLSHIDEYFTLGADKIAAVWKLLA